jgi:hypothetical protein
VAMSDIIAMIPTIISSLISGAVALIVASKQHDKTAALMEYRLKELEEKVDKHNNLVERMYVVETKLNLINRRGNDG